jgi:hypothetical protein
MKKKKPDNQIKKRKDDLQEYIHATLSALSQENAESYDCPDPEELAAFIEGRLAGDEHKAIMVHMNNCTTCRRHWLMIQSVLEEMSTVEATWKEKILHTLKNLTPRRLFTGAGIGVAVAACLLLAVLMPQKAQLSKMISDSYMRLSPGDIAHYHSFVNRGEAEGLGQLQSDRITEFHGRSSPDEIPRYDSFVNKDKDMDLGQLPPQIQLKSQSDALLAFKAGMTAGRARLLNKNEATDQVADQKAPLFFLNALGQWAVVLQCACISKAPAADDFWAEQEVIATTFQEELQNTVESDESPSSVLKPVATISRAIDQLRSRGVAADGCEEIAIALESLENNL